MKSEKELPKILFLYNFGFGPQRSNSRLKYVLDPSGTQYYRVLEEYDDADRFLACEYCRKPIEFTYQKKTAKSKGRVYQNHKCPPKQDQVDKMLNTRGHEIYEDRPTFARRLDDGFAMLAMAGDTD